MSCTPRKRFMFRNTSKSSSEQNHRGCRSGSTEDRNLPRKNALKSESKKKKSHLSPPPCLPVLLRRGHGGRGAAAVDMASATRSQSLPLPQPFLSTLEMHCSIFIQELVDLVFFFGTITKKKPPFPASFTPVDLSERQFLDSSVAHRLTWPNGLMNACIQTAYCYQNGMWEYAMHLRLRNDQEIKI